MAACVRSARFVRKTKGERRLSPWPWKERGEKRCGGGRQKISPRDCATKTRIFFSLLLFVAAPFPAIMAMSLSSPILISAMADWSRRVTASQPRYPFLSSNTQTHNQFFKQSHPFIHPSINHPPMTQAHLHNANGPARFPGLSLFAVLFKNFALHLSLCFSVISPFVQRLSIIFGCSVRALVIHVSLASARPCDKYNPSVLPLYFHPVFLPPSSVSSSSIRHRTRAAMRGGGRDDGLMR